MSESPPLRPVGDLVPGARVEATITGHEPWGMTVRLHGYEPVGASIDLIRCQHDLGVRAFADDLPQVGDVRRFRVDQVRFWDFEPRVWIHLTADV